MQSTQATFIISTLFYIIVSSISYFYLRKHFDHKREVTSLLKWIFYLSITLLVAGLFSRLNATDVFKLPLWLEMTFYSISIIALPLISGITFCFIVISTMTFSSRICRIFVGVSTLINIILVGISFIPGVNIYFSYQNGSYVSGPLISLFFIFTALFYISSVVVIVLNRINIGPRESLVLLSLAVLPALGTIIQIHPSFRYFPLTIMGITLSFVILAMNLQHTNASTDYLTGLYNRRSLTLSLRRKLSQMRRNEKLTIFLLDVDGFKDINDTYGHIFGDNVLRELSEYLRTVRRTGDSVFRFGGDEFIIISSGIDTEEDIKNYIDFIRSELKNYSTRLTKEIPLGFSIGYTIYEKSDDKDEIALLIEIDNYMYKDKRERAQKRKKSH